MNREFVLDCSATIPWLFVSEVTPKTDALLDDLANGAIGWVPSLWHLEVANVLLGAKKKGRIDQYGIEQFFGLLKNFDLAVDGETVGQSWTKTVGLAELYGITVYDAAYLELALRRGLPLATLDTDLRSALTKAGGKRIL